MIWLQEQATVPWSVDCIEVVPFSCTAARSAGNLGHSAGVCTNLALHVYKPKQAPLHLIEKKKKHKDKKHSKKKTKTETKKWRNQKTKKWKKKKKKKNRKWCFGRSSLVRSISVAS